VLLSIDRFAYVATEFWLATWTKGYNNEVEIFGVTFPPQTDGRSAQSKYVIVYAIILGISVIATTARSQWAVTGGARCAKNVFSAMLARIVKAPMSYFETTPVGRILNRFTYDMEVVDLTLTESMSVLMISCSWFIAGVTIMCSILPWIAGALVPITCAYAAMLGHYRKTGADLQRIDALTRSPIQAMLTEGTDGAATIRVFRQGANFRMRFESAADTNSAALLNFISAQRWLGVRIELLGSLVVLVSCTLVSSFNDVLKLQPGLIALLIMWSSNFTVTLAFFVDAFGESEASITSIERVDAMSTLPTERNMETSPDMALPRSWPDRGRIEFDSFSMRYRDGLPLALDGLSFVVEPGKRCGVVGRTGAGKSTLTIALFRLVEGESGRILIDGVDLSTLGLSDVRGRLSIIPQDPFLFAGTIRESIDPFGSSKDEVILEALQAVRLARPEAGTEFLENLVEEGGRNYSVGERQLLCLARALLAKPKVLVMDEATASVDGETDMFIQRMLRTRFKGTTLLTVAHRLNTIMDYDSILVMNRGAAAEFGSPKELLEKNGMFADLVEATGEESARALRQIALGDN
jgi:ABC-type multidrug transport system fused ATPase/permease subunit